MQKYCCGIIRALISLLFYYYIPNRTWYTPAVPLNALQPNDTDGCAGSRRSSGSDSVSFISDSSEAGSGSGPRLERGRLELETRADRARVRGSNAEDWGSRLGLERGYILYVLGNKDQIPGIVLDTCCCYCCIRYRYESKQHTRSRTAKHYLHATAIVPSTPDAASLLAVPTPPVAFPIPASS